MLSRSIFTHHYEWILRYAIDGCMSVCLYVCLNVCMDVTKCIVTKLQMLQTSPLAQIYLLTIEIDLPSDVEKFNHFGRRPPSWIFEDQHLKMLYLLNRLRYRLQIGDSLLRTEFSRIRAAFESCTPRFSIHKMVGGYNTINAITSEELDRSTPIRRNFVQEGIAVNSRYKWPSSKWRWLPEAILILARFSL
jgi:hypothetical protein